ncbi:MAG: hypothetical protein JO296_09735 [Pseudonocardiales bacterium]|nr:hypothetical protein [Pseudonocardiales bacterium]
MVNRERLGAVSIFVGVAACVPSIWQTMTHVVDETYQLPQARHGAGHVQYHMAREASITLGCLGVIGVATTARGTRTRSLWRAMACAVAGFVTAMWSGGPTTGTWAPNRAALAVHATSTLALTAGVVLLRPDQHDNAVSSRLPVRRPGSRLTGPEAAQRVLGGSRSSTGWC